MAAAVRSVFFTLVLLTLLTYFFAIAFKSLTEGMRAGEIHFASMGQSIHTLVLYGTFLDELASFTGDLLEDARAHGAVYLVAMFYLYVLLSSLTVMNMLIGVLCQVVMAVSATETEQMTITLVKEKLRQIMVHTELDHNQNGFVSEDEFKAMLENKDAAKCLKEVGVDVVGLVDIADDIFEGKEELNFGDFMEVILNLRGSNTATVRDIVDLRKSIRGLISMHLDVLRDELLVRQERMTSVLAACTSGDSLTLDQNIRGHLNHVVVPAPEAPNAPDGDACVPIKVASPVPVPAPPSKVDVAVAASLSARNTPPPMLYVEELVGVEQFVSAAQENFNAFVTGLSTNVDAPTSRDLTTRARALRTRRDKVDAQFAALRRSFREFSRLAADECSNAGMYRLSVMRDGSMGATSVPNQAVSGHFSAIVPGQVGRISTT